MTQQICQSRQAERGFTLVELAIVMIIIGLLIGGILKGQELIANAAVTATAASVKNIDAAMTTFRDQYGVPAGDIVNPANRLPNNCAGLCAVAPAAADGRVQGGTANNPGAQVINSEGVRAFVQLANAGLLGGVRPNAAVADIAIGVTQPEVRAGNGGGFSYGYSDAVVPTTGLVAGGALPSGQWLATNLGLNAMGAANGIMTPKTAANLDRKLDDGNPGTGSTQLAGAAACQVVVGGATIYNESSAASTCGLFTRIQQ